ncbi:hypothetical protein [Curtobacterium sp. MCBD17_040]|uniref:hypothetical protein n=1 Tax=Curtobacterium sp. MCBD17_040 TaxID=2175674 RepID=UPI0015E8DC2E|nr:hypothetical protein [Curtobacterium sp. MCBD17_040]WIB63217.1 hypothetical protein DEI94_13845 [Curtobacterium sp. MCBD17_040]
MSDLPAGTDAFHDLAWVEADDGLDAFLGGHLVGMVTHEQGFAARSLDGTVEGSHHSVEAARAELEGWLRWVRALSAQRRRNH